MTGQSKKQGEIDDYPNRDWISCLSEDSETWNFRRCTVLSMLDALPEWSLQSKKEASSSTNQDVPTSSSTSQDVPNVPAECSDQFFDATNANLQMTNSVELLAKEGDENSQIIDFDSQQ